MTRCDFKISYHLKAITFINLLNISVFLIYIFIFYIENNNNKQNFISLKLENESSIGNLLTHLPLLSFIPFQ